MNDDPDSIRLSKAELRAITGASRRADQFAWCQQNGIPAVEDMRGYPVVLRAAVLDKLLPKGSRREPKKTEPDLAALNRRDEAA